LRLVSNMIVRIPRTIFDALAGYIRGPHSFLISQELEWYTDDRRRVLGVLAKDIIDEDFIGTVLGRDARGRFRGVTMTPFCETPDAARAHLKEDLDKWSKMPDAEFWQGDEEGEPLDFFTPVVPPVRLSPSFVRIATGEGFSPARALMESMMPYYEDVDGNFVEQFQSTGFDSRFWELYVFALMTEAGFVFDRSFHAPDFFCRSFAGDVFVEAMTANPTVNAAGLVVEPEVPREASRFKEYYQEYMPIKWGSTLTSKLKKEYWKLPHVVGKPIVFAIQDFHVPRAMTFLNHSLMPYLYGISFAALYDANEKLIVKATPRGPHKWGFKSIETGFFSLPGSENISAVIANPTATISKMNRMGYLAGLGSRDVTMVCVGTRHHHDDNSALPIPFKMLVNDPRYSETWVEGLDVFHNPTANIRLDDSFLIGASHHFFENGNVRSLIPRFHPYQSETLILSPKRASGALRLAVGRSLGSGVLSR
jgi:hypothetical protein